jgi:hypothetical protein
MGITSTNDFGRFRTNQDDEATHVADQLDRSGDAEPAEGFGVPGGITEKMRDAETERMDEANAPVAGAYVDGLGPNYLVVRDPNDDAPDNLGEHGKMNPPRHDRWADENSPYPTPDRVVPSTPTNANPTFADYQVPTQDEPGRAADTGVSFAKPDPPLAGEGSFVVREPTKEATGVTSPTGDAHNDPTDARPEGIDTYAQAKETAAEHGGTIKDFGQPPIPLAGEGSEPPGAEVPEENADAGAEPATDAPDAEPAPDGDDTPPAKSAVKSEWVDYVVANYEITREEAEAMTKDQLVETYGA